jgi:hypothetical protein
MSREEAPQVRATTLTLKVLWALRNLKLADAWTGNIARIAGVGAHQALNRLERYGWVSATATPGGRTFWTLTNTGRSGSAELLQGRVVTRRAGQLQISRPEGQRTR